MTASRNRPGRVILIVATVTYLGFVAWVTLGPAPYDAETAGLIAQVLTALQRFPPTAFVTFSLVEFLANIAMFVPVGALFALLLPRRRWWIAVLIGFGISVMIETSQLLWLPTRVADIRDIIANTTGALIGSFIVWLSRRDSTTRRRSAGRVEA